MRASSSASVTTNNVLHCRHSDAKLLSTGGIRATNRSSSVGVVVIVFAIIARPFIWEGSSWPFLSFFDGSSCWQVPSSTRPEEAPECIHTTPNGRSLSFGLWHIVATSSRVAHPSSLLKIVFFFSVGRVKFTNRRSHLEPQVVVVEGPLPGSIRVVSFYNKRFFLFFLFYFHAFGFSLHFRRVFLILAFFDDSQCVVRCGNRLECQLLKCSKKFEEEEGAKFIIV